jgi:hypothetical protein
VLPVLPQLLLPVLPVLLLLAELSALLHLSLPASPRSTQPPIPVEPRNL